MKEHTRHFYVSSGGIYTQVRHFDENGTLIGEYWEKKADKKGEPLGMAAYVSASMCARIGDNYVRYQKLGRFDRTLLRKLICLGKHEHYTGPEGRIAYISHTTRIFTSTNGVRIVPPFDETDELSQEMSPAVDLPQPGGQ